MSEDLRKIRWLQRFENFEKAFSHFQESIESEEFDEFSDLEKQGLIQQFEILAELSWKVMKDYLVYQAVKMDRNSPKAIVQEAFAFNMIKDDQAWINILNLRNILSHAYDEDVYEEAVEDFRHIYYDVFEALYQFMKKETLS